MSSVPQEFAHLQIPFEDIRTATNDFADEILVSEGANDVEAIYKGQLLRSGQLINISVKRYAYLNVRLGTVISMLNSCLGHKNIISIVGFCDKLDDGKKIIIEEHAVHGSLDKYLSGPTLTWMQRLRICLDAARALSFLHFDKGVIHCGIYSWNILLNENWEAKVSGFEYSIPIDKTERYRLVFTSERGKEGYVDSEYRNTGGVTQKTDVYMFGVVLFEVLCGRAAVFKSDSSPSSYEYLVPMARKHLYEDGKLEEIMDPDLRTKQMDYPQPFTIFSKIAYDCVNEERTQRPEMKTVVKRLEEVLELQQKHENPAEPSRTPASPNKYHVKGKNLEYLRIRLKDIMLATNTFTEKCIGSGTYGEVYKAELDHVDIISSLAIEGKNIDELPKRRSIVAIKRILRRQDGQGEEGFLAEIETLSNCKHDNIVSLLGFCDEESERILVYEFASNRSLAAYLESDDDKIILTWTQRIKICLDIANGLNYLHTHTEDKQRIIHRDIKSDNILLYEDWVAKIADFGFSRFISASILNTNNIAGTPFYLDPEYQKTGYKPKKESDIYSFGVVLFEILCGRLVYDKIYTSGNENGLLSIVRRRFNDGTLKEMVDPKLKEETENKFTLNRGPNQDSLGTFLKIGYRCLAETQAERPPMEKVIKKLKKALDFQENSENNLKFLFEDIKSATGNFSASKLIESGDHWDAYEGEVPQVNGHNIVAVKHWNDSYFQRDIEFWQELKILFNYKHEKVIGLVGYCAEMGKKIIVYEYASRGSLDRYLNDKCLTWRKRLEICIDVASGLDFLHGDGDQTQEVVIHRDIKSAKILLNDEWKAKISGFEISFKYLNSQDINNMVQHGKGTSNYLDPVHYESSVLTKESDIYSFGLVLFEILCGRLAVVYDYKDIRAFLNQFVKQKFDEGKLDEIVFEGIKAQIVPDSLTTYSTIAYQCLQYERKKRPTTSEVLVQLKKALEFQDDYEIWKPKLPADYEKLIQMSESPEIYSRKNNKDLYTMLSKGILLQKGRLWFSLGSNGERNAMISARMFSYKNRRSQKWQSIPKSRFPRVAEMLDIANLKIQIKIRTKFLSPGVSYGVHLIFKFCGPRKSVAKRMYVNLKYKKGKENLHAYFATWREDEWMTIELSRFYNHKGDADFEFLLESFSRCYCGSRAVYVEGIEFRAIDNAKHKEIEKSKEVQVMKSNSQSDNEFKRSENYDNDGKLPVLVSRMQTMRDQMFFVKKVLYGSSDGELVNSRPKVQCRFEEVNELQRQHVFYIKCKIKSQMLSPYTKSVCYLVFKLSEKSYGLHCPVIVRDLRHWRNKETGILYFRTPSPWNLLDTDWVPKKRTDGWMEVIVWKFNSTSELKNDNLLVNLKLISHEETMSGLIVRGLEFRPM